VTAAPRYAELVEAAGHHADLAVADNLAVRSAHGRTGRSRLVSVAARHAGFLIESFRPCRAADDAARFVADLRWHHDTMESTRPDHVGRFHQAADLLGVAHDLLASHLGPGRERLSPFAPGYDDEPALRYLLATVADVVLRATSNPATPGRDADALPGTRRAGYELLARLGPTPRVAAVADLQPLLLAMPEADPDPVQSAADAVDYLRQLVHRHTRPGGEPPTLGTVRAAVLVGFGAHDVLRRHPDAPPDPDRATRQGRLGRTGARLNNRPVVAPPDPRLRGTVLTTYRRLLAIPLTRGASDPAGLHRLAGTTCGLAGAVTPLLERLPAVELPVYYLRPSGLGTWRPALIRPTTPPPNPSPADPGPAAPPAAPNPEEAVTTHPDPEPDTRRRPGGVTGSETSGRHRCRPQRGHRSRQPGGPPMLVTCPGRGAPTGPVAKAVSPTRTRGGTVAPSWRGQSWPWPPPSPAPPAPPGSAPGARPRTAHGWSPASSQPRRPTPAPYTTSSPGPTRAAALLVVQLVDATPAQDRAGRPSGGGRRDGEVLGRYRTEPLRIHPAPGTGAAARTPLPPGNQPAVSRVGDRLPGCPDDPAAAADRDPADLDRYGSGIRREAEPAPRRPASPPGSSSSVARASRAGAGRSTSPPKASPRRLGPRAALPGRWRPSRAAHPARRGRRRPPPAARPAAALAGTAGRP
jgi:hypothetical protein